MSNVGQNKQKYQFRLFETFMI